MTIILFILGILLWCVILALSFEEDKVFGWICKIIVYGLAGAGFGQIMIQVSDIILK